MTANARWCGYETTSSDSEVILLALLLLVRALVSAVIAVLWRVSRAFVAGGNLALMLGLTANDPYFQRGFEHSDTSVTGVIDLYVLLSLRAPLLIRCCAVTVCMISPTKCVTSRLLIPMARIRAS